MMPKYGFGDEYDCEDQRHYSAILEIKGKHGYISEMD